MPGLDPPFYPALWSLSIAVRTRPEIFLVVWWEESGLNPGAKNKVGCLGLNQSCPKSIGGPGYPDGYDSWPASEQLTGWIAGQVRSGIALNGGPFLSAARYLQANMLPATLKDARAPGDVIAGKAGPYASAYAGNSQFDVQRDGTITLGDLGDYLAKACASSYAANLRSAIATTYAQAPAGAPWKAALPDPYHAAGSSSGGAAVASRGGAPVLAVATIGGALAAIVAAVGK